MSSLSNLEFQLLALLGSREQSGREVAQAYAQETGGPLSYGTLYTTLRRLKEAGFVEARDDNDEDGRVRYFKINGHGRAALDLRRTQYQSLAAFGLRKALP